MPDTTLPANESTEQLAATEETLETPKATVETIGTRAPIRGPAAPNSAPTGTERAPAMGSTPYHSTPALTGTGRGQLEIALEAEIEEELIIEDFTIDGICGVY